MFLQRFLLMWCRNTLKITVKADPGKIKRSRVIQHEPSGRKGGKGRRWLVESYVHDLLSGRGGYSPRAAAAGWREMPK